MNVTSTLQLNRSQRANFGSYGKRKTKGTRNEIQIGKIIERIVTDRVGVQDKQGPSFD